MGQRLLLSLCILIPVYSQADCIRVAEANLRAGPSKKSAVTWKARKYTPVKRLIRKGRWVKVHDQDGESHWIANSLLSRKLKCGAIKVKTSNLRSEPSAKAALAEFSKAGRYYPFKIIKRRGKWVYAEDEEKNSFWLHSNNIWIP